MGDGVHYCQCCNAAPSLPLCHREPRMGHAWMAKVHGDNTAELQGRLSLNPLAHIDLMGTVFFPLLLLATGLPVFGWAKPVPVNGRNLRDPRRSIFWISFAGPGMNLLLGTISALVMAIIISLAADFSVNSPMMVVARMLKFSVIINFILAFLT